jgi:hypothetical protein
MRNYHRTELRSLFDSTASFFLSQVLFRTEIHLSVTEIVNRGAEYIALSDALADVLESTLRTIRDPSLLGVDGSFDAASIVGFAVFNRLDGRPAMSELLGACEMLHIAIARRLLRFIGSTEAISWFLFTRALVWESLQEPPDWEAARAVGLRAYNLARKLDLPGLAQAAARTIAQIVHEHFGGREEALQIAHALAGEIGWSPTQEDGVAAILFRDSDFSGALDIWRRILPNWQAQSEFDVQRGLSCRDAAIAAAHLDKWDETADWLAMARNRLNSGSDAVFEAALLIDEGYARWKFGDNAAAVARLTEGLQSIERLLSDDRDERAYTLRKRAGHTMMWMAGVTNGSPPEAFSAPPPACCSSLEPFSGSRVRSTPHDMMWAHLLEFEMAAELGDSLLQTHETQLAKSPYGLVRMVIAILRIRHRLKYLALDDLVEIAVGLAEAMEICRRYYKEGGLDGGEPLPTDTIMPTSKDLAPDTIFFVLGSGVLVLAARGADFAEPIGRWRENAAQCGFLSELGGWLDLAEGLFATHIVSVQATLRDVSLEWSSRILATISNAIDDTVGPEELLNDHVIWAKYLPPFKPFLPIQDVERLVIRGWLGLCERPFLLRTPLTTVPELRKACASSAVGWRKIGEVLAAAEHAIPATVPNWMRQTIRTLIGD